MAILRRAKLSHSVRLQPPRRARGRGSQGTAIIGQGTVWQRAQALSHSVIATRSLASTGGAPNVAAPCALGCERDGHVRLRNEIGDLEGGHLAACVSLLPPP